MLSIEECLPINVRARELAEEHLEILEDDLYMLSGTGEAQLQYDFVGDLNRYLARDR